MPTLVLNAYSIAYPLITNRIRASIYYQKTPAAIVSSIIDTTIGHPEKVWTFSGLPRENYGFLLEEINSTGAAVRNLAKFDVVPGELEGSLNRADEQFTVDVTPGVVSGVNTLLFNGVAGIPNYIGWDIVPSQLNGRGILSKRLDYTWNKTTGELKLVQADDVFEAMTDWNIHFVPVSQPAGNSYPSINDFQISVKTANYIATADDFGSKIICEPVSGYMELKLPDIALVPQGRKLMIEVQANYDCSVKLVTFGPEPIKFGKGTLIALRNERFSVYKYLRGAAPEWRIDDQYGNFILCGTIISTDSIQFDTLNARLLDGSSLSKFTYARLYDYVLTLPAAQVVNFDDWTTNKTYYSYANSLSGGSVNLFRIPDRRGLFERSIIAGKAGDYVNDSLKSHAHNFPADDNVENWNQDPTAWIPRLASTTRRGGDFDYNNSELGHKIYLTGDTGGSETQPKHYLINRYVLL